MNLDNSGLHNLIAAKLDEVGQMYTQKRRELVDALWQTGPCTLPELLEFSDGII